MLSRFELIFGSGGPAGSISEQFPFQADPSFSVAGSEAVKRVCGMNLASDADFWLLENLWKAMSYGSASVPGCT